MRTVEEALTAKLLSLPGVRDVLGERLFDQVAPSTADRPYAVFRLLSRRGVKHLDGDSGLTRSTFLIEFVSTKATDVRKLTRLVRPIERFRGEYLGVQFRWVTAEDASDGYEQPKQMQEKGDRTEAVELTVWHQEV